MAREAEDRTPLDEAIDEVARAMMPRAVPDLRMRVRSRLDEPALRLAWWQPALACATILVALVAWWMMAVPRQDDVATRGVRPATPVTPAARAEGTVANPMARRIERSRRIATRPGAATVEWPPDDRRLPPVLVEPLDIGPVEILTPVPDPLEEIPVLVLEELQLEPLAGSHR